MARFIHAFRVKTGNWHISDASIEEVACIAALYIWQASKMSAEVQKEGFIVIGDMSGFKMKHARQMNIDLVKMAVKLHSSMPSNNSVKGVVAFHSHGLVEDTFNLFKGILPKDIRSMVKLEILCLSLCFTRDNFETDTNHQKRHVLHHEAHRPSPSPNRVWRNDPGRGSLHGEYRGGDSCRPGTLPTHQERSGRSN